MEFEWDRAKATRNSRKHGITFVEAITVFADPFELSIYDPDHSMIVDRFLTVGMASSRRLLVVGYTERGSTIRMIFARRATTSERHNYEEA